MIRHPPRSTLFPYTTLSRSVHRRLLQLCRHHLAETLEAADIDLGIGVELPLQDFVPVLVVAGVERLAAVRKAIERRDRQIEVPDRKSTRLNSSHLVISYAVF